MEATRTAAPTLTEEEQEIEWNTCAESPLYFTNEYVEIEDAIARRWIKFKLWTAQARTLKIFQTKRLIIVLKARQIGLTWLALAYALWLMIFHPAATVLLFSKRDDEAIELLERLKGMYQRLPKWMTARSIAVDNAHEFALSNGSRAKSFPTTAGDSYTATLVIGDEFDLVPDQDKLLSSVQPAIDNGGQMILLSRPDKDRPKTRFKNIYRAAKEKVTEWTAVFLPWFVHPGRNAEWYAARRADILESTGSEDELHEQYPETDVQALQGRTLDKRIPPGWLHQCYDARKPITLAELPSAAPLFPGLEVYILPVKGAEYVIGADTAEGNPNSDDSAATVLDANTGEEVAALCGKFEPDTQAAHLDALSTWYNNAKVLVERNNHGHAVLSWLRSHSRAIRLSGFDRKDGWLTNGRGKALMYTEIAKEFRFQGLTLHSNKTFEQLSTIQGSSLSAPPGEHDDRAVSLVIANMARGLAASQRAKAGSVPKLTGYRG